MFFVRANGATIFNAGNDVGNVKNLLDLLIELDKIYMNFELAFFQLGRSAEK